MARRLDLRDKNFEVRVVTLKHGKPDHGDYRQFASKDEAESFAEKVAKRGDVGIVEVVERTEGGHRIGGHYVKGEPKDDDS